VQTKNDRAPLEAAQAPAASEVVIGELQGLDGQGRPLVSFVVGNTAYESVLALSTQPVNASLVGRQLALLFAGGNCSQPVIMGFIHAPLLDLVLAETPQQADAPATETLLFEAPSSLSAPPKAMLDGQRLVFEAEEEVVLRCGAASITLQKDGRVLIRGTYVVSRASGVNRILGGSVQVN
jgi:hypothetical protein